MSMRSHYCGQVDESLLGKKVSLTGWVHRRRDLGGVIFINLRDRSGVVQVVVHPEKQELFAVSETIRNEYVLSIEGSVSPRPEGMKNEAMATGAIEVIATKIEILNESTALPFALDDYISVNEEMRLRYRYLDLRRPEAMERLQLRSRLNALCHAFFHAKGFLEIETPMLTRTTPEGARDYLVPSRVHPGKFFALPQSPQLFKQLLMMSGADRYYQIVRCFRDEDLRADRTTTFNFTVTSKEDKTLNFPQCLSAAAAFLEGIQLAFLIGFRNIQNKLELIEKYSFEDKQMREAMRRLSRLSAELANIELQSEVRYRPERPDFQKIILGTEQRAVKTLEKEVKLEDSDIN